MIPTTKTSCLAAEQAILGAMLNNHQKIREIAQLLDRTEFELDAHQEIFGAMVSLLNEQVAVDSITLANWLEQSQQLARVGGMQYLDALVKASPSVVNVKSYTQIVRDCAKNRILKQLAEDIAVVADSKESTKNKVNAVKSAIYSAFKSLEPDVGNDLYKLANTCLDRILKGNLAGDQPRKIKTGFEGIDALLEGGLELGEAILVTGNGGQTSFCLNVVENIGEASLSCLVLSAAGHHPLEMTQTILARIARVPYTRIKNRVLSDKDVSALEAAVDGLNSWDIKIKTIPKVDYLAVAAMLYGSKPDVLFIDCTGSESGQDMARIAREFGVAVICSAADTATLKNGIDVVLELSWEEAADRNTVSEIFVCRASSKTRLSVRKDMMLFAQATNDSRSITIRENENADSGLSAVQ